MTYLYDILLDQLIVRGATNCTVTDGGTVHGTVGVVSAGLLCIRKGGVEIVINLLRLGL